MYDTPQYLVSASHETSITSEITSKHTFKTNAINRSSKWKKKLSLDRFGVWSSARLFLLLFWESTTVSSHHKCSVNKMRELKSHFWHAYICFVNVFIRACHRRVLDLKMLSKGREACSHDDHSVKSTRKMLEVFGPKIYHSNYTHSVHEAEKSAHEASLRWLLEMLTNNIFRLLKIQMSITC